MSFYNNFEQSLEFIFFLRENIYLPSMRFLYRKSLFKNVFDQNFFIKKCQPIFKIFAAHFATNKMLNCAKKIFPLHLNSCKISAKNHYHTLRNRLSYQFTFVMGKTCLLGR